MMLIDRNKSNTLGKLQNHENYDSILILLIHLILISSVVMIIVCKNL